MHAFTDGLNHGLGDVAAGIRHAIRPTRDQPRDQPPDQPRDQPHDQPRDHSRDQPRDQPRGDPPAPSLLRALSSSTTALLSSTTTALLSTPAAALAVTRDASAATLAITSSVARSGLDSGTDVLALSTGTVSLAGTALGAVVAAAADTSGPVFEPVASALKTLAALDALDHLAHGIDAINGLPLAAVRHVEELTKRALNMSGKTPTFFDPDADGIVRVPDTARGLLLLGLPGNIAPYAAYALHSLFSYSTSASWLPALDKSLPIRVANMSATKWGKNWGSFERLDWVDDVEIDKFFVAQSRKSFADYWKQGRQALGILLLIFEWGTTWPFSMPSLTLPIDQIPFANDIGSVVRKAILPTIISNYKTARALNPQAQAPPNTNTHHVPDVDMPGGFTG